VYVINKINEDNGNIALGIRERENTKNQQVEAKIIVCIPNKLIPPILNLRIISVSPQAISVKDKKIEYTFITSLTQFWTALIMG
jgi:hypothetical protein